MEDRKSRKNAVRIVGYLKENLLELTTNKSGQDVIRGSIIVAVNEIDSHKIQFYVSSTDRNGQVNDTFAKIRELLPVNTISIASYLKNNPTANFALASSMATKVWVMARFEEFVATKDNREISMVLLKGYKAGFKTAADNAPFVPAATFTCDVYVNNLTKEIGDNGEETGRLIIDGLLPVYDHSVYQISFIASAEQNVAKYIYDHYQVTDTVTLTGDVLSLAETVMVEKQSDSEESFGRSFGEGRQYTTKFTRERRVYGGSKTPIHINESGAITKEEVKDGLTRRALKIKANAANLSPKVIVNVANEQDSTPASFSSDKIADVDDLDF